MGHTIKSISLLVMIASLTTMGFASNQAFAGAPVECPPGTIGTPPLCFPVECPPGTIGTFPDCEPEECPPGTIGTFPDCTPIQVGGTLFPIESTSLILAGAQMTASWMIPVIVSGIGIAIVIARRF